MRSHSHHQHDHEAHGEHAPHPRKSAHNGTYAGHDKHAGHSVAMFRNKFWLILLLAIPTVIWSGMMQQWFGYTAPRFAGSAYIAGVFGTAVYVYGGWPFLQGGYRELRNRLPGMMTLISLAITVAFLYSVLVTLGLVEGMDLWWELATLVAIMLLGHWIEMRSITQAQGALKELAELLPDMALRLDQAGDCKAQPQVPTLDLQKLLIPSEKGHGCRSLTSVNGEVHRQERIAFIQVVSCAASVPQRLVREILASY